MDKHGEIRNKKFKRQISDFGGMKFGKIMPSDLDAAIDFGGKLFLLIEGKYGNAPLKRGQQLLMENLCKAIYLNGSRYAYAIEAEHYVGAPEEDVDMAQMKVRRVFFPDQVAWKVPKTHVTVRRLVVWLRSKHGFTSTMP